MGSTNSTTTYSQFTRHWKISDSVDHLTIWENKHNPSYQLEQYYIPNYEEHRNQQLQVLRKTSHHVVNGYIVDKERFACCQDQQGSSVYIERIPLRLSNIEDIPYPDTIHLFNACILGFQQLASIVGFFHVDEDQVGINLKAQAKVWLNVHFQNSQVLGNRNILQGQMIQDIFQIIFHNSDHQSYPANIPNLLLYIGPANKDTTFAQVRQKFNTYIKTYTESYIPIGLQCIHSAGGPKQINNWCRDNSSFGFQRNSQRLQKNLFQSKLVRAELSSYNQQSQVKVQNALPQPQAAQNSKEQKIVEVQDQKVSVNPSQLLPQTNYLPIIQQPSRPFLVGIPSAQTTFQSNYQPQPQQHQPIIYQPQPPIIYQPQTQPQPQPIIYQHQLQTQSQPQPSIYQPQFIYQQNQNIKQKSNQKQQEIFLLQQQRQKQIRLQKLRNQMMQQQQQIRKRQFQFQQQQQRIQNEQLMTAQSKNQQKPNVYISSNVYPVPSIQKQASRKQLIVQSFPQAESRLQQQRVISQTIQVKQNPNQPKGFTNERYTDYNSSSQLVQNWRNQAQKQVAPEVNENVLNSYGRYIPQSINVNQQRYNINDDGKSSADFLALLRQLKSNKNQENNEVYSLTQTTPASVTKGQGKIESPFVYNNDFSQYPKNETGYGVTTQALAEEPKYSGNYSFTKYERTIDPDLEADILRYK